VRDRLYRLSQQKQWDFNRVLTAYATERLLYRISQSDYAAQFVLKGARLFALWSGQEHRPTRDLDLLGFGDAAPASLQRIFRVLCAFPHSDGLVFDAESICIAEIRSEQAYGGQRIKLTAHLAKARIPLQVDIGFGDVVTPAAEIVDYTTILDDMPVARICAYPRETVIAEKLHAMVVLGTLNTRMKDFYDLWILGQHFEFDGLTMRAAIGATFARRNTPLPVDLPACLKPAFGKEPNRQQLWKAFVIRSAIQIPNGAALSEVITFLQGFVGPPLLAGDEAHGDEIGLWTPSRGWH